MKQLLKVDAIGTPFRNLEQLQSLGLTIRIEEGQLPVLRDHLASGLPAIVALDTKQLSYWDEATDHAVVIVGVDDESVYLNDPDRPNAPQAVPLAEFELSWLEKDYLYAVVELT